MTKKNLLLIHPSLIVGGAENTLINFLNLIDYHRYNVHLVVVLKSGIYFKDIPKEVKLTILFNNRYFEKLSRVFLKAFGSVAFLRFTGSKIKGDYDVAICTLDSMSREFLFLNKASIKKRATLLVSSPKSYAAASKTSSSDKYKRRMKSRYALMDTIISVSEDALNDFKSLYGVYNDMRVIYSPIGSAKVIAKSEQEPEIPFNKSVTNIIAVGRLMPIKGYDLLIEAAKILADKGINFQLYIVGIGPLKEDLMKMVDDLNLKSFVHITGFISNVYSCIAHADIYTMTSKSEGLPTALCEAMILGKPVVVTNVDGCKEVVEHGKYGIIAEPDPNSIANGLQQLITDKDKRQKYTTLSKERSLVFSDEMTMSKYYELFDKG